MKIEVDDKNHTAFIQFTGGASIEFRRWDRRGDTDYLEDGEIETRADSCIFARLGDEEIRIDPGFVRPRKMRAKSRRKAK